MGLTVRSKSSYLMIAYMMVSKDKLMKSHSVLCNRLYLKMTLFNNDQNVYSTSNSRIIILHAADFLKNDIITYELCH